MTWFLLKHVFMFCRLYIGKGKWVYGQTCPKLISAWCPHPHFWVFKLFSNWPPIRVCFIGQLVTSFTEPFYIGCHTTRPHRKCRQINTDLCVRVCRWWVSLWHHFFAFCLDSTCVCPTSALIFSTVAASILSLSLYHHMFEITVICHYTIPQEIRQRHNNKSLGGN